jgi:hypothetical protein
MKKILLGLVLAASPSLAAVFGFMRTVTVDHTKVGGSQTNFPVLVSISDASLKDAAHGGHVQSSSGYDINFFSDAAHTAALSWEIEKYDNVNGVLAAWVKIPSLSSTADTKFYLCYGSTEITTPQGNGTDVWDANFAAVTHLPDGTSLTAQDSTTNGNNGTIHAAASVAGQIGGAASFRAASSQSISLGTAASLNPGSITYSAWIKASSLAAYSAVIAKIGGGFSEILVKGNGKLAMYVNAAGTAYYDGTGLATLSAGTWYYVALTYDSAAGLTGYVNGVVDGQNGSNYGTLAANSGDTIIGNDANTAGRFFDGAIDEVRVSNIARPASWIATEYSSQSNPGNIGAAGFLAYGAEATPACSITTSSLPNGVTGAVYSATMASSSCPGVSWSVASGALPAGLALNSSTGVIAGTPAATGNSSFTIGAASANGSDSKALSIVVSTLITITGIAAGANSPNSINLVWTTSNKASSQASCGTVSGGPYPYASPTVDPVKPGDDYYGVTSHSLAVVVPATNTSGTAYFCRTVSVDSSGGSVTSAEVSSGTTAALSSTPFTVITGPQGWIPYNDQQSGRHGSANTGRGYRDDTFFCAWAADGNNYCSVNDAWGTTGNAGGSWSGSGSLIATGVVQASADGMTISMRGNTTGVNSTGILGDVNKPSTYTADGGRSWNEGVSCARGVCITALPRAPGACTPLVLTRDYFQTTIAPQANTGPSVTGLTFTGPGRGIWGYPTNSGECSWTTYLTYRQFGFAQDWGGTPPRAGAPGYQFPVTHQAGTDAWIYSITYTNGVENWGIMRTPVNNIQVTEAHQVVAQMYNGSGHGADGLSDSNWVSVGSSVGTMFNQYPYGRRPTISWIGGSINRWILMGYAPTPAASAGTPGSIDGSGGILIWDIGPYPWALADAVLVGFLPPDPIMNPTFTPVFPQILESTCKYPSDGSVTCMATTTGSYLNTGTDEYGPYYRWVRFVPRAQSVSLPHTSWFGTKTTHIANGLDALWLMDMPVWSTTITDHAGPKAGMPNGYQITGIGAQLAVNNGMGMAFGWPQSGAMGTPTTVTVATPYNKVLTDFTALLTFMHDANQAPVSGETVLDKTDFQIVRNTTTANSWRVRLGATTSSPFPLATDGAFATLVVRRIGSQVTVYGNAGIGSNLPLTALATFNDGTALAANALTVGSLAGGTQPFYGTIGELTIYSRGLSNPELITEMSAVRSDMASRTPSVVIP